MRKEALHIVIKRLVGLIRWASGALDPESTASTDIVTSVKRGVWTMIAVFLAYSLLQAPSTVLIRPYPAIWRLVHGMAVVYLVALTFLLLISRFNRDDARQFMKYLHPALGVELPERSYGADCRIYVPENPKNRFINVYNTLFDEFVLAHIFGWWIQDSRDQYTKERLDSVIDQYTKRLDSITTVLF
ncbi:hypothetical protein ZIOFF_031916 [Zingiber officinale]|uniref:CDP-diacylglycerol--serine O-phosphatidyltransferase n=1 Tax=Zingiber officinale TaxID=94328 RepID=A0A8J5GHF1_ZINOF|nr:hypothetical protein ZIOFF_031916 [Zingiber officinale]